jgi:pyruvate formate lyase activating enzyme
VSSRLILENLRRLSQSGCTIYLRIPLIPGLTDTPENLHAISQVAAGLKGLERVDLLPYHAAGTAKYARTGKGYSLEELRPHTSQELDEKAAIFKAYGLPVHLGG